MVRARVNWTSLTEARDRGGAIAQDVELDAGRDGGLQARKLPFDIVDDIDDIGAGLFEDDQEDAALAVGPAACFMSSAPGIACPMSLMRIGAPSR